MVLQERLPSCRARDEVHSLLEGLYLLWYHSGTTVTAHVSNVCGQQNLTRHGIIADKDRTCPYSTSGTTVLLRPPYAGASSLMEFLDLRTSLKKPSRTSTAQFCQVGEFTRQERLFQNSIFLPRPPVTSYATSVSRMASVTRSACRGVSVVRGDGFGP